MSDVSLHYTYRRVLYPIVFECSSQTELESEQNVFKLVDLAARKIVSDSSLAHITAQTVPKALFHNLMKFALLDMRDRTIDILLTYWPWKSLVLSELVPPLFDNIAALYDNDTVKFCMRRGIKYTTNLAHIFVEKLKRNENMKLCYLDLSGFPMGM